MIHSHVESDKVLLVVSGDFKDLMTEMGGLMMVFMHDLWQNGIKEEMITESMAEINLYAIKHWQKAVKGSREDTRKSLDEFLKQIIKEGAVMHDNVHKCSQQPNGVLILVTGATVYESNPDKNNGLLELVPGQCCPYCGAVLVSDDERKIG